MNYHQFGNYRIDLDGIGAFRVHESNDPAYSHRLNLFPKGKVEEYFQVSFDYENKREFEETARFLDEFFSVKTEEERKILP